MTPRAVVRSTGSTGGERAAALAAFLTLCVTVAWVIVTQVASSVDLWRMGPWTSAQVKIALAAVGSSTFAFSAFAGIYVVMRRGLSVAATILAQILSLAVFTCWLVALGICAIANSMQPTYVCLPESDQDCRYVISARHVWDDSNARSLTLLEGDGSRFDRVQLPLPDTAADALNARNFSITVQGSVRVLTYRTYDGSQARVDLPTPR